MTSAMDLCESITLFSWIKSIYIVSSEHNNPSEREKNTKQCYHWNDSMEDCTYFALVEWKKKVFHSRIKRMKIQTKMDNDGMYQDM